MKRILNESKGVKILPHILQYSFLNIVYSIPGRSDETL